MESLSNAEELCQFIQQCPTPYHFGDYARKALRKAKFDELDDSQPWDTIPEKGFVIRDNKCLVAFKQGGLDSSIIIGTHCDSPCLQVKPCGLTESPTASCGNYGGGLWYTWHDRDLRLAGRIYYQTENGVKQVNFDSIDPIAVLPSKPCRDRAKQLTPTFSFDSLNPKLGTKGCTPFREYLAETIGIPEKDILHWDLFFVDAQPPSLVGVKDDFVAAARLDNLSSTFCALKSFIQAKPNNTLNVLIVYNHEEIGSYTLHGAKGDLLKSVLYKIIPPQKRLSFIARSLSISADNVHAFHPNFPEKYETLNSPVLGGGITIKKSPGSSYATDMTSEFPLKRAAEKIGINLQDYINRNDIAGGSTLGPMVATQLGIPTVDIGQPQLAMHSIRELVASSDVDDYIRLMTEMYEHYSEHRLRL